MTDNIELRQHVGGHSYRASRGPVTVEGWTAGSKREAKQEALRHLSEVVSRTVALSPVLATDLFYSDGGAAMPGDGGRDV